MRLNQFLARATNLSRRSADAAITSGAVRVNGGVAQLGQVVMASDTVTLDGQIVALPSSYRYVMYHKPIGEVVSRAQQGSDPTIYAHLPAELRTLRPVGRLDRDSSGLLVLTDDGDFTQAQTHPSQQKMKRYEVSLDHSLAATALTSLRQGVKLEDGISHLKVLTADGRDVIVELSEGRNRQIRRTFGALGYGVVALHRTHFGSLTLDQLPVGQWRDFTPEPRP